jgi:hypothetical protein
MFEFKSGAGAGEKTRPLGSASINITIILQTFARQSDAANFGAPHRAKNAIALSVNVI